MWRASPSDTFRAGRCVWCWCRLNYSCLDVSGDAQSYDCRPCDGVCVLETVTSGMAAVVAERDNWRCPSRFYCRHIAGSSWNICTCICFISKPSQTGEAGIYCNNILFLFSDGSGSASCPDTAGCDELGRVYIQLFCYSAPAMECLPGRIWAGCSMLHNLTASCS